MIFLYSSSSIFRHGHGASRNMFLTASCPFPLWSLIVYKIGLCFQHHITLHYTLFTISHSFLTLSWKCKFVIPQFVNYLKLIANSAVWFLLNCADRQQRAQCLAPGPPGYATRGAQLLLLWKKLKDDNILTLLRLDIKPTPSRHGTWMDNQAEKYKNKNFVWKLIILNFDFIGNWHWNIDSGYNLWSWVLFTDGGQWNSLGARLGILGRVEMWDMDGDFHHHRSKR